MEICNIRFRVQGLGFRIGNMGIIPISYSGVHNLTEFIGKKGIYHIGIIFPYSLPSTLNPQTLHPKP